MKTRHPMVRKPPRDFTAWLLQLAAGSHTSPGTPPPCDDTAIDRVAAAMAMLREEHARLVRLARLPRRNRVQQRPRESGVDGSPQALLQSLASIVERQQKALQESEMRSARTLRLGLANAVLQLESYLNIQHFLATGESIPNFHAWPISPDVGVLLLDRIREVNHPLIIEFGSGTSTLLFAKAMETLARTQGEPLTWRRHPLPRRIVSFEHDRRFHDSTTRLLMGHAVAERVQLHHAPLTAWKDGDQSFQFYDCEAELAFLDAALGPSPAHILVLVDGPPGSTCHCARYPAVPLLNKHLGRHRIDIFLDDAARAEEQATIDRWRSRWRSQATSFEEFHPTSEKGLYVAWTSPLSDHKESSHESLA